MRVSIKWKVLVVITALLVFLILYGNNAWVVEASENYVATGKCGDNLKWTLDDKGVLTISGEGEMYNVYSYSFSSWDNYIDKITNISIGNKVTSIANGVFADCSSLKKITIPNSVTYIGRGAFMNCSSLKEITIPNSVTGIAEHTFEDCSSLSKVTIPNSVKTIGVNAFANCSSLKEITIPNSVKNIWEDVFWGCSVLKKIYFSGNALTINSYAFEGVTATAYYPANNSTWTASKLKNYGGKLTWKAWKPDKTPTLQFKSATVKKNYGDTSFTNALSKKITDGKITYKSSNTAVASIDSKGKVTIKGIGTVTITATSKASKNYKAGKASYKLTISKANNTITAKNVTKKKSKKAQTFSLGAKAKDGAKLTYTSSSKSVKVSPAGKVTIAKNYSGKATITITAAATGNYKQATKKVTITVKK